MINMSIISRKKFFNILKDSQEESTIDIKRIIVFLILFQILIMDKV